ncbi:MAG: GNAT family N-acetyltransferase [Bacteroidales bacterium]|nr:GNAT family N-acetyltransferase [Lentimicrobiaceae bacterium]MDD5694185.1 GNAT family N-acetyltransferase [Bacteroidales bacterium]
MQKIIDPVDPERIRAELTADKFVRDTNNGHKQIFIVTYQDSPYTMLELGRLREVSFRDAGGGTGKETDIDEFDTDPIAPFKQLIVWSPQDKAIVGGYRYLEGSQIRKTPEGNFYTPTAQLFRLSDAFINDYLPFTIELGRSFVQPEYQPIYNIRTGIYSLDNLWDGLGALTIDHPEVRYFFGKITMYPRFNIRARDMILFFLHKYFPDPDELVRPFEPLSFMTDSGELEQILCGQNYAEDYRILMKNVRILNESIPPLVNAYMNLSATMRMFGTCINQHFGMVEESGILMTIEDIYDIKKDRHVSSYKKNNKELTR